MILLTGSNSILGKRLLLRLVEERKHVRCLDREKPAWLPGEVQCITGDVTDPEIVSKACQGISTIFHLMEREENGRRSRREMKRINISVTRTLLAAGESAGVERFIFLSTYQVYGKSRKIPIVHDPKKRPRPVTPYGKDKLAGEDLCLAFAAKSSMKISIFRTALMAGGETENPMILMILFTALAMGSANRVLIAGSGENRFQLLHPDDAVDAFMGTLTLGDATGTIFNLGSEDVPTQNELAAVIQQHTSHCTINHMSPLAAKLFSLILAPFRSHYFSRIHLQYLLKNVVLEIESTKEILQWKPKHSNRDILVESVEWYKKHKI